MQRKQVTIQPNIVVQFGRTLILIFSLIALLGCSQPRPPDEPLTLYLISSKTLETEPTFALSNSDFVVTEDHIIHYDWEEHTFLLSETVMSWYKDDGLRFGGHFTLTSGDTTILTGRVLSTISAMKVNGPVMYVTPPFSSASTDRLEAYLAYGNDIRWFGEGETEPPRIFPSDDPMIVETVYARLEKIGKLKE